LLRAKHLFVAARQRREIDDGEAFGWIGSTTAFGAVVRKP